MHQYIVSMCYNLYLRLFFWLQSWLSFENGDEDVGGISSSGAPCGFEQHTSESLLGGMFEQLCWSKWFSLCWILHFRLWIKLEKSFQWWFLKNSIWYGCTCEGHFAQSLNFLAIRTEWKTVDWAIENPYLLVHYSPYVVSACQYTLLFKLWF